MLPQRQAEILGFRSQLFAGEGIDGVLHRVGRDDQAVLRAGVGGVEVAPQHHGDFKLLEAVLRARAGDFHDADLGFAVMVVCQFHIRIIRLFGYLNPNQAFEHH